MKKYFVIMSVIICGLCFSPVPASPGVIQFDFDSVSADLGPAPDLSWDVISRPVYREVDEARYGASAGKYLIQDFLIPLRGGNDFRVMLTCSSLDRNYACLGIQLLIADERETPAAVLQSLRLGDGYFPELITVPEDIYDVMFRVVRPGNNTEANVYAINPVLGGFEEKLTITRRFPERMNLKVACTMTPGGIMEVVSEQPSVRRIIDMSGALDALVEDELYQPNGNPIRALENLRLVRGGWEEENIYHEEGETRIDAGMSLISLSEKPVVDITAVLTRDAEGNWAVSDFRLEPSLPYRSF